MTFLNINEHEKKFSQVGIIALFFYTIGKTGYKTGCKTQAVESSKEGIACRFFRSGNGEIEYHEQKKGKGNLFDGKMPAVVFGGV